MAPIQRYAELVEQMQWLVRRIQTFGVHVHVGIRDGNKAIPIVNALAAYLPHFLAITASSPFWCGYDTGLASSRSVTFGALPTAGPPHRLANWEQFEDYMDTLLRAGTIRSIKEVWWDIRPHPDFGTVEIRMSDGVPTLREVGMVAALSQCLVQLFDSQLDRGYTLPCPSSWVVRDNKWRATRYGLDAIVITDEAGATAPLRDELFELLAAAGAGSLEARLPGRAFRGLGSARAWRLLRTAAGRLRANRGPDQRGRRPRDRVRRRQILHARGWWAWPKLSRAMICSRIWTRSWRSTKPS